MLVLDGCVQPGIAPEINAAAARVLDRLGVSLIRSPGSGCCGAISQHLSAEEEARTFMRRNIDAWWPAIEQGAEAIVITASGCGSLVKEYGYHLRDDPDYRERAERISGLTRDLTEVLAQEPLEKLDFRPPEDPVASHTPCSLQHAQGRPAAVDTILERLGFTLSPVRDAHLCCGSAGTYSILQKSMSEQLLANKIRALECGNPNQIATANIGCLAHLRTGTQTPVNHWVELVDRYSAPGT